MRHWLVALMSVFIGGAVAASCAQGGVIEDNRTSAAGSGGATSAAGNGGAGGISAAQSTSGETSSSVGSGGAGGAPPNPCEGVLCDMPPANECDGQDLKVYAATGTCDKGACTYGSTTEACPNGCSAGMCMGDPCIGVTCNSAPPAKCADANTLEVPQAPGACDAGSCSYFSNLVICPFGCSNAQCNGDPCAGVTCNQAAANYCFDADHLRVRDLPGACDPQDGMCDYTTHDEYCAFGCQNGACANDPCVGVVCPQKPSFCSDASTVVQYDAGQCVNGLPCTYGSTSIGCPNGCVNGQCVSCTMDAQCGAGKWCSNNQCVSCSTDLHCGANCAACGGAAPKCNGTSCVQCLTNAQCVAGNYCDAAGQCQACNNAQHCGAACVACGGQTSICGAAGCVECLVDADCGGGKWCSNNTCQACNTNAHCGAGCVACGGTTPICKAGASCVECLTNADCGANKVCDAANTCQPFLGCTPPALACNASGGNQDGGCQGSYRISRPDAGSAAGFTVPNSYGMCDRNNDFTGGNCGGSGSDAEYRLFMRKGETANVTLMRGNQTCSSTWAGNISLRIYEAACAADCSACNLSCTTLDYCIQSNNQSPMFVAPNDGWYTFVVDTVGPVGDKGGVFYLNIKLACMGGNCLCQ